MKNVDLRKKLIQEINLSNNKNLLEEFYNYLIRENRIEKTYKLSEEQITAVEEAKAQIKNGDYLTNDQADQDIKKWLDK